MAFLANKSDVLSLVPLLQKIMTGRGGVCSGQYRVRCCYQRRVVRA